jgi:Rieske Fe-S protein
MPHTGGPEPDRRSMLARLVSIAAGLVTGAAAIVAAVASAPRTTGPVRRWRRAASSASVSAEPVEAVITEQASDGWYQSSRETVVFLDRDGDGYRALSAVCQHLGCRVNWDETKQQFLCPCHGGVYDRNGKVVSGPPPRALDRLNVRINPDTFDLEVEL